MELHLQKYRYAQNEYLVYDCNRESYLVGSEEVRVMCSANFGIDVKNMLIGPVVRKGRLTMLTYNPDGSLGETTEETEYVFNRYLSDAGYRQRFHTGDACKVSRIYLYDHFILDNHIQYVEKQNAI